ncbi:MAG: hypothetical protein ACAH17_02225 [Candidatus Paceibacterota bacterium]
MKGLGLICDQFSSSNLICMNAEKNIDNSLTWDCQWLIGPITRQVHFASLLVRRRTGEWKVTYGPFPHLERFELSNIPLSFASNNLSLQEHFDELISLLSNSHYCSGVDLPQNISLEAARSRLRNLPGDFVSTTSKIWSRRCVILVFQRNHSICEACRQISKFLQGETTISLSNSPTQQASQIQTNIYTSKDVLDEMLAIHQTDLLSVPRRCISYSAGFHHFCTRFSDLIGSTGYEKLYQEGCLPLVSSSTLRRHISDDTSINVADGLTMAGALAAFENCKLAFESEWKKLSSKPTQAVKTQVWDAFRTVLLAEDEANIKPKLLFARNRIVGATSQEEDGQSDSTINWFEPEKDVANSAIIFVIRSMFFMDWRYPLSAQATNSGKGRALSKVFEDTVRLLRAAGFQIGLATYDGALAHNLVGTNLKTMGIEYWPDPAHCLKKHWTAALKAFGGRIFRTPWGSFNKEILFKTIILNLNDPFSTTHRMGLNVIEPNSYEKMSVPLANKFFSIRFAVALGKMKTAEGLPDPEAACASRYISWVASWWALISDRRGFKSQADIDNYVEQMASFDSVIEQWAQFRRADDAAPEMLPVAPDQTRLRRRWAFPSRNLFSDLRQHFFVVTSVLRTQLTQNLQLPLHKMTAGQIGTDIVEHTIGAARAGCGGIRNICMDQLLNFFASSQRSAMMNLQMELRTKEGDRMGRARGNRSYSLGHSSSNNSRKSTSLNSTSDWAVTSQRISTDRRTEFEEALRAAESSLPDDLRILSDERTISSNCESFIVKPHEEHMWGSVGYHFDLDENDHGVMYSTNHDVASYVVGSVVRSVLIEYNLLENFFSPKTGLPLPPNRQLVLSIIQKISLHPEETDASSESTPETLPFKLLTALERKKNALIRISSAGYHQFFWQVCRRLSAERKSGFIFVNRRAFVVRLLCDMDLKKYWNDYLEELVFERDATLSQNDYDKITAELRSRLIVSCESKMRGEMTSQLNNTITYNLIKTKKKSKKTSTGPGASHREQIANTSATISAGTTYNGSSQN